jgi:aspartyl/asparaginyl beta-hydroxylase (cupin superfamily)
MTYGNALQARRPETRLPAALQTLMQQAERRVSEGSAEMERYFESHLGELRTGRGSAEMRRFERALDLMLGKQKIHHPAPTLMLFPWLRSYEFFDRERCPWLEELEAATEDVQREFAAVIHEEAEMVPYIKYAPGEPLGQWGELNHSRRWKAYFFWEVGRFFPEHAARCPRTVEALRRCPQVDIPNFGPTAFYSILDANTQIPVHTGAANTRLTCHLPLVVPPGCGFRVGGETREWKVGEAWVFDDTIEHEAWNRSNEMRAILLFDVWNPELTDLERDLVRSTKTLLLDYYRQEEAPDISL